MCKAIEYFKFEWEIMEGKQGSRGRSEKEEISCYESQPMCLIV